MAITHKKWNLIVAAAFVLGFVAVVSFNYIIDPYEVFKHGYLRSGYAVNERFRKVDHLLNDQVDFDSYIMGSSVMGVYDPGIASQLSGHRYYNLSFLAGTPKEAFDVVRTIKASGRPVKEILFGVDFFTFYEHPKSDAPMGRAHPAVSGESWQSFYASYLFTSGLWQGGTRIVHNSQQSPSIYFDVDGTGMYHLYDYDRRIAANHALYVSEMFPPNAWGNADVEWIDKRFVEFAQFSRWLDENGIRARFFIHPFYQPTLDTISRKSYAEFVSRLRRIRPDIIDFSTTKNLMSNPNWYYDKKHYRPPVAGKIMEIMFSAAQDVRGLKEIDNER